jgi:hypothetical protein
MNRAKQGRHSTSRPTERREFYSFGSLKPLGLYKPSEAVPRQTRTVADQNEFRELLRLLNACIQIVSLLKIYVFKQVATDSSSRHRVTVHLDARQMRNSPFHGHQPLTQITSSIVV